jgi:hypothetical protein
MAATIVLDRVQGKTGTFASASAAVPPGVSSATATADMPTAALADPGNTLRIGIEACFDGVTFRPMAWSLPWTGGPGQPAPALTWHFRADAPPQRVRAILENLTQVASGLTLTFA